MTPVAGDLGGGSPATPNTKEKPKPSRAKALSGSSATRIVTDPKQLQSFRILCVQWATGGLKWSASDAGIEFERFVDNATAHDRQYKDWLAAWRNWCRSPYCKTTAPKDDLRDYLKGPMRG